MRVSLCRWPRNEELIEKVARTKGNPEAIKELWEEQGYSQTHVFDSLFYAHEAGLITMTVQEKNLEEWLDEELFKWLPEYLEYWVKDETSFSSRDGKRRN